jgi:magnesium-transporting ATPase (P-type)
MSHASELTATKMNTVQDPPLKERISLEPAGTTTSGRDFVATTEPPPKSGIQAINKQKKHKKNKKKKEPVPLPPYHTQSVEQVLQKFDSSPLGLREEDIAARVTKYGKNELKGEGGVNPFILLLRHLVNGLTIILLIAAILSIITEQWIETGVILFVVVANTLIGFLQEFKSEQTMASLKKLSAPVAKVLRDGELAEIPAPEIVPGDIITFEQGDIVSADLRIIDASNLRIDEAMLTGESEPVEKQYAALTVEECPLGDKKNLAFMNCIVTQGRGKGNNNPLFHQI